MTRAVLLPIGQSESFLIPLTAQLVTFEVSKHHIFSLDDRHIVSQLGRYHPVMAPLAIQFLLLRKLLSANLVPGLVLACICIMKIKCLIFKLLNFCFGWMWIEVAVRYFYKALSSIVENLKPCLLFMRIRCLCVFRFLLLLRYIYGFKFCKLWWPKAFH